MNDWRVAGCVLVPVRSERGLGAKKPARSRYAGGAGRPGFGRRPLRHGRRRQPRGLRRGGRSPVGQGHRHILLHGATQISKAIRTRLAGFADRARAWHRDVRIDELCPTSRSRASAPRSAPISTAHAAPPPDGGVFAVAALDAAGAVRDPPMGSRMPEQIALVGFDDADWMQITWPSITAVAQPVAAIAERAASALLARVEGESTGFPVQYLEPCTMLVRQSAGQEQQPKRRNGGRGGKAERLVQEEETMSKLKTTLKLGAARSPRCSRSRRRWPRANTAC
jgi:LacI family transcriptional regulator